MKFPVPSKAWVCAISLALGLSQQKSPAATVYWDSSPSTDYNQNGSGVWDTTTTNWTSTIAPNTNVGTPVPANTAWANGSHVAQLGTQNGYTNNGVGGTITLGSNITLNSISKSGFTGAYIIDPGAGNYTLTLTGPGAGFANNNDTVAGALTINASVLSTVGLRKTHSGVVILAADNTWSGDTTITTLATTGNTSILQIGNGGTTGTLGSGDVSFESNAATAGQSVLSFNRSDIVTLNQNLISASTGGQNRGELRQAGAGTLIVSSANTAFTGVVDVDSGILQIGDGSTNGSLANATRADIAAAGIIRFSRSDDASFNASISGSGHFEKIGSNTLTLSTSTASTHTGQARIAAGILKIGNTNALSTASTVSFTGDSTFDLGTYDQTVANILVSNGVTGTIIGAGKLTLGASNFIIGASDLTGTNTLNMSGLGAFEFNGANRTFNVGGTLNDNTAATPVVSTGIVRLAQSNTINAQTINISMVNGGGNAHTNAGYLYLGQTNAITAGTLNIGYEIKNKGVVTFDTGITGGTVTLRGTDASQRMAINIGRHNSNVVSVTESFFDSTAGNLDAMVSTLTLGVSINSGTPALGRFSMGLGTLDATTIVLGRRESVSSANNGGASPIGTLELSGGTIVVQTMVFADKIDAATAGDVQGIFNFNSGTLRAQTIQGGLGTTNVTRQINWSAGTITTYNASTNLSISDVAVRLNGNGNRIFDIGTGRTASVSGAIVNGVTAPGGTATAFRKTGDGILLLSGTNTHTGITDINQGIVRTAGSNVLSDSSGVHFSGNATLDIQANTDAIATMTIGTGVAATVHGTGGTLSLTGNQDWIVEGTGTQSLDMSGLTNFVFNSSSSNIHIGGRNNSANSLTTITFASGTNTITAASFGLGSRSDGDTLGQNRGVAHLGKTNSINANSVIIGSHKTNVLLDFASGITDGTLSIRATNGTGRANMTVGIGQSGGLPTDALADLSAGSVDALLNRLEIGQNSNTNVQNQTTRGTFTMSEGIVDATTIVLGNVANNSTITAASNAGHGTFNLNGNGTVKVNTLIMSEKTGSGDGAAHGTFNLTTGTLSVATIRKGHPTVPGTQTFNWNSGTIQNYDTNTDLTVNDISLTLNGSTGTRRFNVGPSRTATVNSTIIDGTGLGANAFTKDGTGSLILTAANTYSGLTTVNQGALVAMNATGSATGTGGLLVASDAIFSGNGRIAPTGSNGVTVHGLLDVGDPVATVANTLTVDLAGTTGGFTSDGVLAVDLFTNAGGDNSGTLSASDRLLFTGVGNSLLDFSGVLYLGLNSGSTLDTLAIAEGDRWQIVSFAGLTGSAPTVNFSSINSSEIALDPGLAWTVQSDNSGIYAVVTSVPEPSRAILLLIGISVGLLRRRR